MKTQNIIQPLRHHLQPLALAVTMGLGLATSAPALITIETVLVGDAGNTADTRYSPNRGAVASDFRIGKYEVQNSEYAAFLNAVAATDTNALYSTTMATRNIVRSGSSGSYTYAAVSGKENFPIQYISWARSLRFANWMHNGQPTGVQDSSTTEDGAYLMSLGNSAVRKPGATWFVPNLNEWYKAAYYKGGGTSAGYWSGPYKSNTTPIIDNTPPYPAHVGGTIRDNYGSAGPIAVGSYPSGDSVGPYGTYDQGGNLFESPENRGPYILGGGGPYGDGPYTSTAEYNANPWGDAGTGWEGTGFRMAAAAAASSPTYDTWAAAQVPPVTGGPSGDSNNDGVANGVAYFMKDAGLLTNPGIDGTGKVTWPNGGNIANSEYGVTKQFVVQTSSDLQTWNDVPATGDPNLSNIAGSVSYTLPPGEPKIFARLKVTPN